jgi:hypothetical protein
MDELKSCTWTRTMDWTHIPRMAINKNIMLFELFCMWKSERGFVPRDLSPNLPQLLKVIEDLTPFTDETASLN